MSSKMGKDGAKTRWEGESETDHLPLTTRKGDFRGVEGDFLVQEGVHGSGVKEGK